MRLETTAKSQGKKKKERTESEVTDFRFLSPSASLREVQDSLVAVWFNLPRIEESKERRQGRSVRSPIDSIICQLNRSFEIVLLIYNE